jgi:hypothetical protein
MLSYVVVSKKAYSVCRRIAGGRSFGFGPSEPIAYRSSPRAVLLGTGDSVLELNSHHQILNSTNPVLQQHTTIHMATLSRKTPDPYGRAFSASAKSEVRA